DRRGARAPAGRRHTWIEQYGIQPTCAAEVTMPDSHDVSHESPSQSSTVTPPLEYSALVIAIAQAHDRAQRQAAQAVNVALTLRNWLIGYYVVEYQQHGSD